LLMLKIKFQVWTFFNSTEYDEQISFSNYFYFYVIYQWNLYLDVDLWA